MPDNLVATCIAMYCHVLHVLPLRKYEVAHKRECITFTCFNEILRYSQFHKENKKNVFGIYSDSIIVTPRDNNRNVFCFSTFIALHFFL